MTTGIFSSSTSALSARPRPDEPEGTIVRTGGNEHSAPFPRGGSQGVFAVRVISTDGGGSLTATVQHKNADETSWSSAASFSVITGTGTNTLHASEIKEQVRWRFGLTGGAGSNVMMRFQTFQPVWED